MHIPFYITLMRLLGGLRSGWKDPEFKALLVFVLILLSTGTVFYSQVEHWSILDSVYFSVTTLTTVGFGDLVPKTDLGKIFTIIYIVIGVGTILSFVTLLAKHSRESDPIHQHLSKENEGSEKVTPIV